MASPWEEWHVQERQDIEAGQESVLSSVAMTVTDEPVWQEHEAREDLRRRDEGRPTVAPAPPPDRSEILGKLVLSLSNELAVERIADPGHLDRQRLEVRFLFEAMRLAHDVSLSCLALRLRVRVEPPPPEGTRKPFAYDLQPQPKPKELVTPVLVGVNVGVPGFVGVKAETTYERKKIFPEIQVLGLNTADCRWIVADQSLLYRFEPLLRIDAPRSGRLEIDAALHVEIHREWMKGISHRTYGISMRPRTYVADSARRTMLAADLDCDQLISSENEPLEDFMADPDKFGDVFSQRVRAYVDHRDDLRRRQDEPAPAMPVDWTAGSRSVPGALRSSRTKVLVWTVMILVVALLVLLLALS